MIYCSQLFITDLHIFLFYIVFVYINDVTFKYTGLYYWTIEPYRITRHRHINTILF